jgi:hypothetical protein
MKKIECLIFQENGKLFEILADRWQIKKSKNIKTELNERQQKAIGYLLEYGKITNEEYKGN